MESTPDEKVHAYRATYELLRGLINMLLSLPQELQGTPMIEIGSNVGDSTEIFSLFFSPVYSIDPFVDDGYMQRSRSQVRRLFFDKTSQRNIAHTESLSQDVAGRFADESVSFVYIDGDHRYEHVKRDIQLYWPKIKKGGFIGGHDYDNPDFDSWGIKAAVDEAFGQPDKIFVDYSWLVKKEKDMNLSSGARIDNINHA